MVDLPIVICVPQFHNPWDPLIETSPALIETLTFDGRPSRSTIIFNKIPFKDEAQTALFKDPVRTAL